MGGYGSGRWAWHTKKTTVEECEALDISGLYREGLLGWDRRWWGSWQWTYTSGQKNTIGLEIDTTDRTSPWVRLFYKITSGWNEGRDLDYKVRLQTTRPHFGGWRWWFTCPLVVGGQPCGRRVRKLYLPPGGVYFGCRHCYDLTYRSSQESDKRVSALRRRIYDGTLNPLEAMERREVDPILILKAMERLWR